MFKTIAISLFLATAAYAANCTVPDFIGMRIGDTKATWVAAGFNRLNISRVGTVNQTVASQTLPPNSIGDCATATITVSYLAPTPTPTPTPTATPIGGQCNSDGSSGSVQTCVNNAQPGDTITLPAGSFTWTQSVTISKGITILGNGTTIVDNITKSGNNLGAFKASGITDNGLLRISGITFQGGSTPDYQGSGGEVNIDRISTVPNIRVDNCTFTGLKMRPIWLSGSPLGVIDHSNFTMVDWVGGIIVGHQSYQGIGDYGDNSWAQPTQFGSDQFVFIEDCTFNNFSAATFIDSESGERVVVRHCTINSSEAGNHGTETGQRHRGGRVFEFYQNTSDGGSLIHNWNLYLRSGAAVVWGNYSDKYDSLVVFAEYRLWFSATPWGQADATNPWDVNDPVLYASGTATSGTANHMVDSGANFPNYAGYILRNTSHGTASQISDNTSHDLHFDSNPQGQTMSFSAGDHYEVRRVIHVLDQPGYGKSDLISGSNPVPVGWPHELSEPVHIWGNTLGPNFGNGNGRPVVYTQGLNIIQNQDWFYSLDNSAALPGYVPYTYPHPLTN